MLWITWQDTVQNADISLRTELPCISALICKRQSSVFCHVARMPASTTAHQALKLQVDLFLNRFPCSANWKRRPDRLYGRWVDQMHQDYHSSRPMAFRHQERPFQSNTTVLANYALMTMMTILLTL